MRNSPLVEIRNTTRTRLPRVPFAVIAKEILGTRYRLSLVLCGNALAQRINRTYRKKNYPANVLSFSLAENEGEIFLNTVVASREAKKLSVSQKARLIFLFIHGCLHLKGLRHGDKMDALERKIFRKYA